MTKPSQPTPNPRSGETDKDEQAKKSAPVRNRQDDEDPDDPKSDVNRDE